MQAVLGRASAAPMRWHRCAWRTWWPTGAPPQLPQRRGEGAASMAPVFVFVDVCRGRCRHPHRLPPRSMQVAAAGGGSAQWRHGRRRGSTRGRGGGLSRRWAWGEGRGSASPLLAQQDFFSVLSTEAFSVPFFSSVDSSNQHGILSSVDFSTS